MTQNQEEFVWVKTIASLVVCAIATLTATCNGGGAVRAVATKNWVDLDSVVWALVFGIIAIITLRSFILNKNELEKGLGLIQESKDSSDE